MSLDVRAAVYQEYANEYAVKIVRLVDSQRFECGFDPVVKPEKLN